MLLEQFQARVEAEEEEVIDVMEKSIVHLQKKLLLPMGLAKLQL